MSSHYHVTPASRDVNKKFWAENMKKGDHLEDISVDGILIKRTLTIYDGKAWTGFIRLTTGASTVFF